MQHSFQKYTAQYPALIRLGVPITIGQLGTIVLGFADTLMIGHHSLPELAAASFVTNMFTLALLRIFLRINAHHWPILWPIEARSHRRSVEKWLGGRKCAHAHPAGRHDHALP